MSIWDCFQSMQFFNAFLRLANVHGCMWTVSTGVISFDDNRKHRICRIRISLPRFDVRSSLLWLICQLGLWFFNHNLIKCMIASFVPGRAVLTWCGALRNATRPMDIGWKKDCGCRLESCFRWLAVFFKGAKNACCPLASSMLGSCSIFTSTAHRAFCSLNATFQSSRVHQFRKTTPYHDVRPLWGGIGWLRTRKIKRACNIFYLLRFILLCWNPSVFVASIVKKVMYSIHVARFFQKLFIVQVASLNRSAVNLGMSALKTWWYIKYLLCQREMQSDESKTA